MIGDHHEELETYVDENGEVLAKNYNAEIFARQDKVIEENDERCGTKCPRIRWHDDKDLKP